MAHRAVVEPLVVTGASSVVTPKLASFPGHETAVERQGVVDFPVLDRVRAVGVGVEPGSS